MEDRDDSDSFIGHHIERAPISHIAAIARLLVFATEVCHGRSLAMLKTQEGRTIGRMDSRPATAAPEEFVRIMLAAIREAGVANRAESMSGAIPKVGVVADPLPELASQLVISSSHRGGACWTTAS